MHIDVDADGTVETNADDPWTYQLYNERWQLVASSSSTSGITGSAAPADFERVTVYHAAGLGGSGSSSYIDSMILVEEDTTANGLFDGRSYYVQNWRHDVVAMTAADGDVISVIGYTSYGEPVEGLIGDLEKDGDVDLDDFTILAGQFGITDCASSGTHGCAADFDRDGDVDGDDFTLFNADFGDDYADKLGVLAAEAKGRGYAGYVRDEANGVGDTRWSARNRDLREGRWLTRDPMGYVDGASTYGYVRGMPVGYTDPMGLCASGCGGRGMWQDRPGGGTNWGALPYVEPSEQHLHDLEDSWAQPGWISQAQSAGERWRDVTDDIYRDCGDNVAVKYALDYYKSKCGDKPLPHVVCSNKMGPQSAKYLCFTNQAVLSCSDYDNDHHSLCFSLAHEIVHLADVCDGTVVCNPTTNEPYGTPGANPADECLGIMRTEGRGWCLTCWNRWWRQPLYPGKTPVKSWVDCIWESFNAYYDGAQRHNVCLNVSRATARHAWAEAADDCLGNMPPVPAVPAPSTPRPPHRPFSPREPFR